MNIPLVSILVPVYNVEKYIERCARSLFEQTYENLEYIFVDDCTSDSSMQILERVIQDYPVRSNHAHMIKHHHNRGLAATRNTLLDNSHGEFVTWVDSDDWLELNAIELLVYKQQETDADIVTGRAWIHENGKVVPYMDGGVSSDKSGLLVGLLTYKFSVSLWRRLIRRRLYLDHHITCDESCDGAEDFQTLPRLVYYASKISGIEDYIYHYDRDNVNSIMNTISINIKSQLRGLVAVKDIVQFFSDKEIGLREITEGMDVRNIHYRMKQNAVSRSKKGFYVFCRLMKDCNKEYWHLVKWDKMLVRCLESNYYLAQLMYQYFSCRNKIRQAFLQTLKM